MDVVNVLQSWIEVDKARGQWIDRDDQFQRYAAQMEIEYKRKADGDPWGQAAAHQERVVEILERRKDTEPAELVKQLGDLGDILLQADRVIDAQEALRRAVSIAEQGAGPSSTLVADQLLGLAESLRAGGDAAGATAACERALRIFEAASGADSDDVVYSLHCLAMNHSDCGALEAAEANFRRAIALHAKLHGPDDPGGSDLWFTLHELYADQERWADAERAIASAIRLMENAPDDLSSMPKYVGDRTPNKAFHVASLRIMHAEVLEQLGRHAEAGRLRGLAEKYTSSAAEDLRHRLLGDG